MRNTKSAAVFFITELFILTAHVFSAELKRIAAVWTVSDLSAAARYGEYYAYY